MTNHRHCGDCTLCCRVLSVKALPKPANTRCKFQRHTGCSIYKNRPPECKLWSCRWLTGDDTADLHRPDRVGYVIDMLPDVIRANDPKLGQEQVWDCVQVRVDNRRPDDWRRDEKLREYMLRRAEEGKLILIRYDDERARLIVPPPIGDWLEFETNLSPELLKTRKERHGY